MNAALTALVAVFATLAGSTLTFFFQRHVARQAERLALERILTSASPQAR
ncbi:hypothetical protein [Streptomyces nojiriensis]